MNVEKLKAQMLQHVLGELDRKVVKTVPLKADWAKKFEAFKKVREEANKLDEKATSLKKLFWATVENDLNDYRNMSINTDTNEIEIYEDKDEE